MAENSQECILAGKNLKPMCSKGNLGRIPEPKEPIEAIQLDFWGPINYLPESQKYVIEAVNRLQDGHPLWYATQIAPIRS